MIVNIVIRAVKWIKDFQNKKIVITGSLSTNTIVKGQKLSDSKALTLKLGAYLKLYYGNTNKQKSITVREIEITTSDKNRGYWFMQLITVW